MSALNRAAGAWTWFWAAPGAPLDLAVARVVLALHALWLVLSRDIPGLSALPAPFWSGVPAAARWRYLLFPAHPALEWALEAGLLLALLGVLLGVATRACCLLAGLLLYHLAPLETLFFTPSPWARGLTLAVLGLLVLSAAPTDARLALRAPARVDPAACGWPLRLVRLFVCQQYFFSGWAKLMAGGLGWASAENVRGWLLLSNLDDQLVAWSAPGLWLADHPVLAWPLGAGVLVLELAFPLALVSRRARTVMVPAMACFHLAVFFTLNYAYLGAPLLLLLVDWDRDTSA